MNSLLAAAVLIGGCALSGRAQILVPMIPPVPQTLADYAKPPQSAEPPPGFQFAPAASVPGFVRIGRCAACDARMVHVPALVDPVMVKTPKASPADPRMVHPAGPESR